MSFFESQLDMRIRRDDELTERAYAELATGLGYSQARLRFEAKNNGLVEQAVSDCLHYYGAEPGKVPEGTDTLEERIACLCRPSGTMHRRVRLDKDWQKSAFGPMLGKLSSGEAIALIPCGFQGYAYIDPSTGRKTRVNAKTAAQIEAEAVFFYRALPKRSLTVRELIIFMLKYLSISDVAAASCAVIAASLIGLLPAAANSIAFSRVVPSGNSGLILPIAALIAGAAVSSTLIGVCRSLLIDRIAMKVGINVEAAAYSRLLNLPSAFFRRYDS